MITVPWLRWLPRATREGSPRVVLSLCATRARITKNSNTKCRIFPCCQLQLGRARRARRTCTTRSSHSTEGSCWEGTYSSTNMTLMPSLLSRTATNSLIAGQIESATPPTGKRWFRGKMNLPTAIGSQARARLSTLSIQSTARIHIFKRRLSFRLFQSTCERP